MKGLNGLQTAELRADVTLEWHVAFTRFKEKIDQNKTTGRDVLAAVESEEFYDALEAQEV